MKFLTDYDIKRSALITVFILFFSFALVGHAEAQDQPPNRLDDAKINDEIELELAIDDRVDSGNLEVSTHDGIVLIEGWVEDIRSKERAYAIASSIRGVNAVVCDCEVRAIERPDFEIRNDIINAFAVDPVADSYEVEVDVEDGIVELDGEVESFAEKQLSADVAKRVKGVKEVENKIEIDYDAERKDPEIRQEVERRLRNNTLINSRLIDVKVEDHEVTLSGAVGSLSHKEYAYDDAWVAGVTAVDTSELDVKWWAYDDLTRTTKHPHLEKGEIEEAVENAILYDPRVDNKNITVDVEDGIAELRGRTNSMAAKNAAEQDARNTMGVWKVENMIEVHPTSLPDDHMVEEKVKQALLWNPITEKFEIDAEVIDNEVYLEGTVDTRYEKMIAEDIVSNIFGAVNVVNNIKARAPEDIRSDSELESSVRSQFTWSVDVDGVEIDIEADDGVVILDGNVSTRREYNAAVDNAFEGGAVAVKTHLRIEGTNDYEESLYYYDDFFKWTNK